ncbi:MAG: shikimate dehydrogenase [Lachnospiraceae bacterium]|nr:shikimate dehydrogenase [Lachnospiraceae bacterium]
MTEINGQTALYGIIGNPIGHTMSPIIHNTISSQMGINAVYVPFRANDDLDSMVKGLYSLGVRGLNVTVPYKTDVISRLAGIDDTAAAIGAVNTLKYTEKGYHGYNTDILGLKRELLEEGISLKGRDTVILGAGGAARAVAFLCAQGQPDSITFINRTPDKAQIIKKDLVSYAGRKGMQDPGKSIRVIPLSEAAGIEGRDLIVFQCTNVGLSPHDDECVLTDEAFYSKVSAGIDLIYKPAVTRFMKYVEDAGGRACNGLKMLLYQAVCAYEIWNDLTVPDEVIRKVAEVLK